MLHDLDKIILHKTVVGLTCPGCGGELQALPARKRLSSWLRWLPGRNRRSHLYRCGVCRRRYELLESG